jgi:hypothetical protein
MAAWIKLASAIGVAAAFASLTPSCADNNQTLFIRQIQALQAPACTVTGDVAAFTTPTGFLDVGVASSYVVYPLVGNQLLAKGDARQSKAETNRVQIEGAEIELVEPSGASLGGIGGLPNPYTVIASGTIDPTSSADATYNFTAVELMPPVFVQAYRRTLAAAGIGASRTIHARIKVFGKTLGGTEVETGIFTYPINVCYGCSVFVPAEAVDAKLGGRNCSGGATTTTTTSRTVCVPGQDQQTDCRACQGSIPLCTPCDVNDQCAGMISQLTGKPSVCNTAAHFCE